jgi:non-ribosomal peptide synthetase component F
MTLTCAWRLAARVVIGSGAVLLVTDVANRTASVDRTIGCFTNQVVLAGLVDDGCTLADQLDEERSLILDAFDHSRLPYDEMVRTTQPTRRGGDDPYGQLKVVLQNIPPREVIVGGIQIAPIDLLPIRAKNDILVNAVEHAGGLLVDVDYRADRYEAATISRLLSAFHTAFERLATHRDTSVAELVEVAVARLEALDARNASIFASTARNMLAGGLDRAPGTTR